MVVARVPLRLRVPAWRWQMRHRSWQENGKLKTNPMKGMVAAVSVGIVNGEAVYGSGIC